MASSKKPADRPTGGESLRAQPLADVVASLLRSVVAAHRDMDGASVDLARAYLADPVLQALPAPAFAIAEATLRLRFAIAGEVNAKEGGPPVLFDVKSLEKIPPHLVSEVEIRLTPQTLQSLLDAEDAGPEQR